MSVQATTWVWEHSKAQESTLLVALAIADAANKQGSESCQSVRTLSQMARCSESTVHRALRWLQDNGEIEVIGQNARYRGTNVYRFRALWNPEWDRSTPVTGDTSQNDTPVTGGTPGVSSAPVTPVTGDTRPQRTPQTTDPTTSPAGDGGLSSEDELFEDFWAHYPRKVARKDARTAFGKALQRADYLTVRAGLVAAIKVWRNEGKVTVERKDETLLVRVVSGDKGKGVPHGATWLNGDRWTDDYTVAEETAGENGEERESWMRRTPE